MSSNVPMYGFGGGSGGTGAALTVTAPARATVTVSKDGKSKTKVAGTDGVAVFKGLSSGDWTLSITDGTQTAQKTVTITADYDVSITFNVIPDFTYSGVYEVVNDEDEPIAASPDNWKIRFLTSGVLTFNSLDESLKGIDVFLVGGGGAGRDCSGSSKNQGGGGGGGYTKTELGLLIATDTQYEITIGAGGSVVSDGSGNAGGSTSAFGFTVSGGSGSSSATGGKGGSGGGNGFSSDGGGNGGADGASAGGAGQGTTTREFGGPTGRLYAGGGGGGSSYNSNKMYTGGKGGAGGGGNGHALNQESTPGTANTGGGGGGSAGWSKSAKAGGSGIVIIRNAREVA